MTAAIAYTVYYACHKLHPVILKTLTPSNLYVHIMANAKMIYGYSPAQVWFLLLPLTINSQKPPLDGCSSLSLALD